MTEQSADFIWPSDIDRAENDELNRVCEQLEAVTDERDQFRRMHHNAAAQIARARARFSRHQTEGGDHA